MTRINLKTAATLGMLASAFAAGCLSSCSSRSGANTSWSGSALAEMPVVAEKVTVGGDTVVVVDLSKAASEAFTIKASDLIDDLKLVKLDDSDEALIRPGQTWITSDRIIIYDGSEVKQFDLSGKYIGKIGAKGNGPGEYTIAPYDVYVNEAAGRIFLAQYGATDLFTYDLEGNFIEKIPLAYRMNKGFVGFTPSDSTLTLAALQFDDTDTPYQVWTQDMKGNVITSVSKP